jgi:hypothetical protein
MPDLEPVKILGMVGMIEKRVVPVETPGSIPAFVVLVNYRHDWAIFTRYVLWTGRSWIRELDSFSPAVDSGINWEVVVSSSTDYLERLLSEVEVERLKVQASIYAKALL